MSVADKDNTGAIEIEELGMAAGTFMALQEDEGFIDEKMDKYDTDKTGNLSRDQLKLMMQDLNDGIECSDGEVDTIMEVADLGKTGTIERWEVRRAVEEVREGSGGGVGGWGSTSARS